MEFPAQCFTNVQKIGGFSSISYLVFSLNHVTNSSELQTKDIGNFLSEIQSDGSALLFGRQVLQELEARLKALKILVCLHPEKEELWLFQVGQEDWNEGNILKRPVETAEAATGRIVHFDGIDLKELQSGIFRSSALEYRPSVIRRLGSSTSAPLSTSEHGLQSAQTVNSRALQNNASLAFSSSATLGVKSIPTASTKMQSPTSESLSLYELFVSAIVNVITYSLSKSHNYVPLDFCTYVNGPRQRSNMLEYGVDPGSPLVAEPVTLETLDVRLTTTGTLVICSRHIQQPALRCMGSVSTLPHNMHLWLAPGGLLARYVGRDNDAYLYEGPRQRRWSLSERERAGARSIAGERELCWKKDVRAWLDRLGLASSLGDDDIWYEVQILLHPNRSSSLGKRNEKVEERNPKTILWPATLCFGQVPLQDAEMPLFNADTELENTAQGGLKWLQSHEHRGALDPLTFAENWFVGYEERTQAMKAKKAARDIAMMTAESTITANHSQAPSPAVINALKANHHGDLHTASGVYPTPPDGVQSHSAIVISMNDGPGATPADAVQHSLDNMDSKGDDSFLPADQLTTRSSTEGVEDDFGHIGDGGRQNVKNDPSKHDHETGNELFEELDEAMFGGNAVTEEDFSFFDEPDLDDFTSCIARVDTVGSGDDAAPLTNEVTLESQPTANDGIKELHKGNADDYFSIDLSKTEEEEEELDKFMIDANIGDTTYQCTHVEHKNLDSTQESAQYLKGKEDAMLGLDLGSLSPPLSPVLIRKKLLPVSMSRDVTTVTSEDRTAGGNPKITSTTQGRKQSNFDAVSFSQTLGSNDHKYAWDGRFGFYEQDRTTSGAPSNLASRNPQTVVLPEIGLLKRTIKPPASGTKTPQLPFASAPPMQLSAVTPPSDDENIYVKVDQKPFDLDTQVTIPPTIGEKYELSTNQTIGSKRKRDLTDDQIMDTSSVESAALLADKHMCNGNDVLPSPWNFLAADAAAQSFADHCWALDDDGRSLFGLEGADFIAVAQILTDQIISGTLQPSKDISSRCTMETSEQHHTESQSRVIEAAKSIFSRAVQCDVQTFLGIEDLPPEVSFIGRAPIRPINRRLTTGKSGPSEKTTSSLTSSIFRLPSPHVRVHRAEAPLEILASAIPFWETLGFGPVCGPKNVTACCVYPGGQGVEAAAAAFLDRIGTVYESCRLGNHTLGKNVGLWKTGMVPVSVDDSDTHRLDLASGILEFNNICTTLGTALPMTPPSDQYIVIYIVNPFDHPSALVGLCAAFANLCKAYIDYSHIIDAEQADVVLQIIPLNFITSSTSLVIPSQSEYTNLALEVYERLGSNEENTISLSQSIRHAPPITLGKPLLKRIGFKLSAEPPSSLIQETPCLHIAYSKGPDHRWISAAWTDNLGGSQTSVSYCLGMKHSTHPLRPLHEIATEIWKTTLSMISAKKVPWRIFIARVGIMPRSEIDIWTSLAAHQSQPVNTLILLTADPNPSLTVYPPPDTLDPTLFSTQPNTSITPAPTPQPSSDQFANATTTETPTPDLDPSATLIDITDTTWGLIPAHRLHNTHSLIAVSPVLASGYLLKRASVHDDKPFALLSVNLLGVSGGPQQRPNTLLKEVLALYRGLATIARVKGVVGVESTEPWHVAAARKAVSAVGRLM